MKQKSPESTLLADNTQWLIITNTQNPGQSLLFCSTASQGGGGGFGVVKLMGGLTVKCQEIMEHKQL